ncbi:MAG TPA: efflux transporter outer membrane subunit [Phycisphaerae bacterium]|nr:efflux transporter outer membrane subunit [Phycisphaerae bacterium]HOJ73610.1 efflux transporter outer membrane subunit [Phycisphaerae bacterium]HOM51581.1 efflux transporter outer membrane subunit [Phycisphaerae bacterium]HON66390.1 efflux transporter outer membrane subunit [Phycisphaerae bacterium]HOQ85769.1 efflux transporter outer membrane subunit [Phycisphaerae bacterium]
MYVALFGGGLLLAGCMVGPDYEQPEVQVPETYRHAGETPSTQPATQPAAVTVSGVPVNTSWWLELRDPLLNSLVDRAIQSNLDVRIAEARVVEARALRRVVASELFPQFNTSGGYTYRGGSRNASPQTPQPSLAQQVGANTVSRLGGVAANALSGGPGAGGGGNIAGSAAGTLIQSLANRYAEEIAKVKIPRDSNLFQAGFDASWEIDIFGGTRRAIEAAEASIQANEENLHDVLTVLIAEVARNYVEARSYQKRLAIARKNIGTQEESLELTRVRFQAGLTSELDVAQAAAQLATTSSQVPVLEVQWIQSVHRLGVLLGQHPGALFEELENELPIPPSPPQVPVGLPSDLLRRRADIRAAERNLAAATANIGVAVADLYPRFTILGSFGTQTHDMQYFLDRNSAFWSIGPSFSWPIFTAGRIRGNIAVQEARQQQQFIAYHSVILNALEEVENALAAYRLQQVRYEHLENAVNANQRAVDLANERYRKGLTDFLRVLESERSLYVTEDQLVESEAAVVANYIALQKALGGGWEAVVQPDEVATNEAHQ